MKCVVKLGDSFGRITTAAYANFVQAVTARMVANSERERQSVFYHNRVSADVSFAANPAELMHARISTNVRAVFDDHVARKRRCVSHDHVVAQTAVVRDMYLGHQKTV